MHDKKNVFKSAFDKPSKMLLVNDKLPLKARIKPAKRLKRAIMSTFVSDT